MSNQIVIGHPFVVSGAEFPTCRSASWFYDSEAEVAESEVICVLMTYIILTAIAQEADLSYWCHLFSTVGLPT